MSRNVSNIVAVTTAVVLSTIVLVSLRPAARRLSAADAGNSIPYFIADGAGKSGYRSSDRELAEWAFAAWQRSAGNGLHLTAAPESRALIRLYWADPSAGEYGETQSIMVGGQRGAAVYVRPDINSLGEDIAMRAQRDGLLRDSIVYLTCLHELGHALGLEHTRDYRDIMYYFGYGGNVVEYFYRYRKQLHSRSDIAGVSGLSDADVARIKALYSRE